MLYNVKKHLIWAIFMRASNIKCTHVSGNPVWQFSEKQEFVLQYSFELSKSCDYKYFRLADFPLKTSKDRKLLLWYLWKSHNQLVTCHCLKQHSHSTINVIDFIQTNGLVFLSCQWNVSKVLDLLDDAEFTLCDTYLCIRTLF